MTVVGTRKDLYFFHEDLGFIDSIYTLAVERGDPSLEVSVGGSGFMMTTTTDPTHSHFLPVVVGVLESHQTLTEDLPHPLPPTPYYPTPK